MDAEYVVKFQQIRYVNTVSDHFNPLVMNFKGHFFLQKTPGQGTWLSGTKVLNWPDSKMMIDYEKQSVQYDLDRQKLYIDEVLVDFSDLNTAKISLEIGSKWNRVFGNQDTTLTCTKLENLNGYNDLPEVKEMDKIVESDDIDVDVNLFDLYFKLLKREAWSCIDENKKHILRIKNHFSMKPTDEISHPIDRFSYYEGVFVSFGYESKRPSELGCEIIEIKYLDMNDIVMFQGKVQLKGGNGQLEMMSPTNQVSDQNYRKDVHYLLSEPYKVYNTPITRNGMIVEVGQTYFDKNPVKCKLTCRKPTDTNPNDVDNILQSLSPKVTLVWSSRARQDKQDNIIPLAQEQLLKLFDLKQTYWMCKCDDNNGEELIRIVNTLKLKPAFSVSNVYHYDGVTVSNRDNTLVIVERKYASTHDKSIVKFDHYMKFEDAQNKETETYQEAEHKAPLREAHFPATEIMSSAKLSLNGRPIILLVGSKWKDTLANSNDAPLICERVKDHSYKHDLAMKIFTNPENVQTENPWSREVDVSGETFDVIEQQLWSCKRYGMIVCYRVVNRLFMVGPLQVSRIYYYDGVTVEIIKLHKNFQNLQLTEVKFVDPTMKNIVKYDGQFLIRSNTIVESLFEKPNELKESKVFISPSKIGSYYSLDFLKFAVSTKNRAKILEMSTDKKDTVGRSASRRQSSKKPATSEDTPERTIEGVSYRPLHVYKYSPAFLNNGMYFHRIFEIGTSFEEVYEKNGKMQCMLDTWNPVERHHYIPRVVEFIDEKEYHFDRDEFLELFQIKNIEVWICVNDADKFLLRVKTSFTGKVPMFAVRYPDGVEVSKAVIKVEQPPTSTQIYTANVIEVIYLDPTTSKVVKYEGDLQDVSYSDCNVYEPTNEPTNEKEAPEEKQKETGPGSAGKTEEGNRLKRFRESIVKHVKKATPACCDDPPVLK